ncbi:MAG: tetratricopeptide repeat protein, partial [Salinivenus sp.]
MSSAQAQDSQPSDQDKAMHYSLYYENYKNDNFERARSDLNWLIENAPGYPKDDDRNFERQFKLYRGLAEEASEDEARTAYLDTAATILATAPDRMEESELQFDEYEWEIMRGRFVQEYKDSVSDLPSPLDDSVSHYRKAYDLAPEEINPYYIKRVLESYMDENEQQEALEFASTVEQDRGDDDEVAEIISSVRDDIFDKNPGAQVTYFEEQYEAHPDSLALMQQLFNAYVERGSLSKASELAPELMEEDDISAETIREIANMRLEDGRPEDALEAYERLDEMDTSLS